MSFLAYAQSIPSFYYIPIILFTLFLLINVINGFIAWYNYFQKPVLKIIYDNGKYNIRDTCNLDYDIIFYRIKIKNLSKKTVDNVSISVEGVFLPKI